jgi:NADH:ubiquinone oxidoreductase subunit 3 (chain A)
VDATTLDPRLTLLIHAALAVGLVGAVLFAAWALRDRRRSRLADSLYESGVAKHATGKPMARAPFFLVAALFVIFDLEAAILYAWAVAAREAGALGLAEATIFVVVLLAALVYLWADGALDTGPRRKR